MTLAGHKHGCSLQCCFLMLILIEGAYCCYGAQKEEVKLPENDDAEVDYNDETLQQGDFAPVNKQFVGNLLDPAKWINVDPEKQRIEKIIIKEYKQDYMKKKEQEQMKENGGSLPKFPKTTPESWPEHWKNLGVSIAGDAPPPHAYQRGVLLLCFQTPMKGNCNETVIRWYYSTYGNTCSEFIFGGCGGNSNNFYTKRRCMETCMDRKH